MSIWGKKIPGEHSSGLGSFVRVPRKRTAFLLDCKKRGFLGYHEGGGGKVLPQGYIVLCIKVKMMDFSYLYHVIKWCLYIWISSTGDWCLIPNYWVSNQFIPSIFSFFSDPLSLPFFILNSWISYFPFIYTLASVKTCWEKSLKSFNCTHFRKQTGPGGRGWWERRVVE